MQNNELHIVNMFNTCQLKDAWLVR